MLEQSDTNDRKDNLDTKKARIFITDNDYKI